MQTFLPHGDYEASAQSLDSKRLNKQILEGYQILKVLSGASPTGGWRNHPAVLMWKNAEWELVNYIDHMVYEADLRGIKTINNKRNIRELAANYRQKWSKSQPFWIEDNTTLMRMTTTHKVSLFNKDPLQYASFQPATYSIYNVTCCTECKYYWPTHPLTKKS